MKVLNAIIDTWNVLEKYDVECVKVCETMVAVSNADFEKMMNESKNKNYIARLRNRSEFAKQYEACH